MPTFGVDLNMDLYPANEIVEQARLAEREGFDRVWVSDHFHPWLHEGAHEGFAWAAIASAAALTRKMPIGTCVTAPILRYHPAIVAQAFATLELMHPRRIFLGLGLGEGMNEVPLGYDWPPTDERIERLEEAIRIIRLLWTKDFVTYKGKYYRLTKANLYDKPTSSIPIIIASNGPVVTRLAGKYADGYLTHPFTHKRLKEKLFPALEEGAKEAKRDPKSIEKCLMFPCSYDEDYDRAEAGVARVAANLVPGMLDLNVYDPRKIEALGRLVDRKEYPKLFLIATEPESLIKKSEEYIRLGFSHVNYVNFGPDEMKFIRFCGTRVVPELRNMFGEKRPKTL